MNVNLLFKERGRRSAFYFFFSFIFSVFSINIVGELGPKMHGVRNGSVWTDHDVTNIWSAVHAAAYNADWVPQIAAKCAQRLRWR